MISRLLLLWALLVVPLAAAPTPPVADKDLYPPGPDSKPQDGVPKGVVFQVDFNHSEIYPGTQRRYSVYIPAQYNPDQPACVYVGTDGVGYNAPVVFDNLIARKELPVIVGVFVPPGTVPPAAPNAERFDRSYEYDSPNETYVRFLLEEILPDVEKQKTPDGRPIRLSHSGADRAIGGGSSGGICAFNAVWQRPDAFSRAFVSIGTFAGLRGGDVFPALIRKTEPKPIRVFMQDGENDANNQFGDWWFANQMIERSLEYAGYEVSHVWGVGTHNGAHAALLFPDGMRFLWKDWPQPIHGAPTKNPALLGTLLPDQPWQRVEGIEGATCLAADAKGKVTLTAPDGRAWQIAADGTVQALPAVAPGVTALAFAPDGRLDAVRAEAGVMVATDVQGTGESATLASGLRGRSLIVAHNGNAYVSEPAAGGAEPDEVWLVPPAGEKKIVDTGLQGVSGLALSPDQSFLFAAEGRTHWIYSYQIAADGTLQFKQRFYWLHVPDLADDSGAGGMALDKSGQLYVATRIGVQFCDRNGRVVGILPLPGKEEATALCFGGADFSTLYVAAGGHLYKRLLKVHGAPAWDVPVALPAHKAS